jgi:hypothetical protein
MYSTCTAGSGIGESAFFWWWVLAKINIQLQEQYWESEAIPSLHRSFRNIHQASGLPGRTFWPLQHTRIGQWHRMPSRYGQAWKGRVKQTLPRTQEWVIHIWLGKHETPPCDTIYSIETSISTTHSPLLKIAHQTADRTRSSPLSQVAVSLPQLSTYHRRWTHAYGTGNKAIGSVNHETLSRTRYLTYQA